MAQRGALLVWPSSSWAARSSSLDHDAVDLVVHASALPGDRVDVGLHRADRVHALALRVARQAHRLQHVERLDVAFGGPAVPADHAVDPHREHAVGGERAVLLTDRAGRSVARVGEGAFALFGEARVHAKKLGLGHEHLAADLEPGRWRLRLQLLRQVVDVTDVDRHVLAHEAVAAGGGARERAVLVGEHDRETVDLGLAHERGLGAERLHGAGVPRLELGLVEHVVEGQQLRGVPHGREQRAGGSADLLRGRGGIGEIGVLRLERFELGHELVVLFVRDRGRVELVVAAIVLAEGHAEFFEALAAQ